MAITVYRIRPDLVDELIRKDCEQSRIDRDKRIQFWVDKQIRGEKVLRLKPGQKLPDYRRDKPELVSDELIARIRAEEEAHYQLDLTYFEQHRNVRIVHVPSRMNQFFLTYEPVEDRSEEAFHNRNMTGGFKSLEEAFEWFTIGGR